jgi:tetratricopeptide (TPR) repeat protein
MSSIQEALRKAQVEKGGRERPNVLIGLRPLYPQKKIFRRALLFIALPLIAGMILAGLWLRSVQTKSPMEAASDVLKSLLNIGKSALLIEKSHQEEISRPPIEKKGTTIKIERNDSIKRSVHPRSSMNATGKLPGKSTPLTEKSHNKKASRHLKKKRETALRVGGSDRLERKTARVRKIKKEKSGRNDFVTGLRGQGAYKKAMAVHRQGDFDQAIVLYKLAIKGPQAVQEAFIRLGNIYFEKKNALDKAIFYYRKAVDVNPSDAMAHNNLGTSYLKKGDIKGAITEYLRAIELKDDFAIAYYNMACAQVKQGEHREALSWLKKAITLDPESLRWAKEDPDFDAVKNHGGFQELLQVRKAQGGGPREEMNR